MCGFWVFVLIFLWFVTLPQHLSKRLVFAAAYILTMYGRRAAYHHTHYSSHQPYKVDVFYRFFFHLYVRTHKLYKKIYKSIICNVLDVCTNYVFYRSISRVFFLCHLMMWNCKENIFFLSFENRQNIFNICNKYDIYFFLNMSVSKFMKFDKCRCWLGNTFEKYVSVYFHYAA